MKLAAVYLRGQWIMGELEAGLPPSTDDETVPDEPVVLIDAMIVVHQTVQIESPSLDPSRPAVGLAINNLLVPPPLEPAPLHIEYGQEALVWQLLEVDESRPPTDLIRRYLKLVTPAPSSSPALVVDGGTPAREGKRTRLTS